MTKQELVAQLAKKTGLTKKQVKDLLDALAVLAKTQLKATGTFKLPGVIQINLVKRKARMGRNPGTGKAIRIPSKTTLKARIPTELKVTLGAVPSWGKGQGEKASRTGGLKTGSRFEWNFSQGKAPGGPRRTSHGYLDAEGAGSSDSSGGAAEDLEMALDGDVIPPPEDGE